jgi:predicted alpha/beta superfamily hydrolase
VWGVDWGMGMRAILVVWAVVLGAGVGLWVAPAAGQELVRPEAHPGGVMLVVTDRTGLVSNESPLYVASNAVGWNAGDASMRLSGRSDLRWQILLPGPVASGHDAWLEFKFTRGSWETVEVAADLSDIPNRTLEPVPAEALEPGRPYVVELEIEGFADQREGSPQPRYRDDPTRPLNVTGEAFRVQVVGGAGGASGALRDVVVWLPPGYHEEENASRRYPVLYLQDGQNVFDFRPPTPAEWGADETAARLIEAGVIEPLVIVGVPHSGANRSSEYTPWGFGDGDGYVDWLVREVVPRVERVVRARGEGRGIGGASLGGLVALRAAQRHPDVFDRVLCESPSLGAVGGLGAMGDFSGWRARTHLGFGGLEHGPGEEEAGRTYAESVAEFALRLVRVLGPEGEDRLAVVDDAEAGHDERAWAARLPAALEHLYGVDPEE